MKPSEAVLALEGLASEPRLGIFRLLVVAGPDGLPAGRIAARMKLPAPTLSFHLAQLKNAGLIVTRQQRNEISGHIAVEKLDALSHFPFVIWIAPR